MSDDEILATRAARHTAERNEALNLNAAQAQKIARLTRALHAAIASPKGVVPDCAAPFYDPQHHALRGD